MVNEELVYGTSHHVSDHRVHQSKIYSSNKHNSTHIKIPFNVPSK